MYGSFGFVGITISGTDDDAGGATDDAGGLYVGVLLDGAAGGCGCV